MAPQPTVFVVDDDPAVRKSIAWLIQSVGLAVETYGSGQELLDAIDPARPGCLVLDVRMPGMSGLDLLSRLERMHVFIPVIILTGYADVGMAVRAMKQGAVDFLEKPFHEQELLDSVQSAVERDAQSRDEQAYRLDITLRAARLTQRERQVMELIAAGKVNKQVAVQLRCSSKTVETHRARVMEKMQAGSLAELVRMTVLLGNGTARLRSQ